jgi:UDP-glucose 4-epimerase
MKNALITGGAGFIGSHVADELLRRGWRVTIIDNFSTGRAENIQHLVGRPDVTIIKGDVRDLPQLPALVAEAAAIYHLAASVGVKNIMDNLVASINNNTLGTERVLEAASRPRCRILVASTSEVYGKTNNRPSREDDDLRMGSTIKSRWSYACSKALDEYLAFAYYHERTLPVTVARLFNTVGERQSDAYGMVIPTFIRQALLNQPISIHGDGRQQRCFGYVKEVAWALVELLEHDEAIGEVYNIGSTEEVTINELADRVLAITGSRSLKKHIPYGAAYTKGFDDAERRRPDIAKIKNLIGFEAKTTLDDIIKIVGADVRLQMKERAVAR